MFSIKLLALIPSSQGVFFCTELESGLIEISEGLMGPVLFSIPLQSLEPPNSGSSTSNSSNAAGLLFFSLSEFGGKWRCRLLKTFCQAELPSLMKLAKVSICLGDTVFRRTFG